MDSAKPRFGGGVVGPCDGAPPPRRVARPASSGRGANEKAPLTPDATPGNSCPLQLAEAPKRLGAERFGWKAITSLTAHTYQGRIVP